MRAVVPKVHAVCHFGSIDLVLPVTPIFNLKLTSEVAARLRKRRHISAGGV